MTAPKARKCLLCGTKGLPQKRSRPFSDIQRHHLVPCDGRGPRRGKTVWLCRRCHRAVHRRWSNEELATKYNTPGLLKAAWDTAREEP